MSENKVNYQWYPGHMTKSVRQLKEDIKLIEVVLLQRKEISRI